MKNYTKWILLPFLNLSCQQQFGHQRMYDETTPLISNATMSSTPEQTTSSTGAERSSQGHPLPTSKYNWKEKHDLLVDALQQEDANETSIQNCINTHGISFTEVDEETRYNYPTGNTHMHELLQKNLSVEKYTLLLAAAGDDAIDHTKRNLAGENLLDIAVKIRNEKIVEKILLRPSLAFLVNEASAPHNGGHTPLHLALYTVFNPCNVVIVELLINNGAFIERKDADGNTPLHFAARICNSEIVDLLLNTARSRGLGVERYKNIENNDGAKAVDLVSQHPVLQLQEKLQPSNYKCCNPSCVIM